LNGEKRKKNSERAEWWGANKCFQIETRQRKTTYADKLARYWEKRKNMFLENHANLRETTTEKKRL